MGSKPPIDFRALLIGYLLVVFRVRHTSNRDHQLIATIGPRSERRQRSAVASNGYECEVAEFEYKTASHQSLRGVFGCLQNADIMGENQLRIRLTHDGFF